MRIIGGKYRSRVLAEFPGTEVRPTADRVKESLFNILSLKIYGARVLDLFSGSGALALFEDILTQFGPDSFIGRTASVLMGSTETTFYTIALYFGATKVRNTRHCLPAALLADLAGICLSAAAVGLFLGR